MNTVLMLSMSTFCLQEKLARLERERKEEEERLHKEAEEKKRQAEEAEKEAERRKNEVDETKMVRITYEILVHVKSRSLIMVAVEWFDRHGMNICNVHVPPPPPRTCVGKGLQPTACPTPWEHYTLAALSVVM